jgi:hypothetical protein
MAGKYFLRILINPKKNPLVPNQACGSLDCHQNCMKPLHFVCQITTKDKLGLTGFGFTDCMK